MDKESIAKVFGKWTENPSAWLAGLAAVITGTVAGIQAAANFADPLVRWCATLCVFLLFLGGIFLGTKTTTSTLIGSDGKPIETTSRAPSGLIWGAVCSFTLLMADVCYNFSGLMVPLEISVPEYHSPCRPHFSEKNKQALDKIPVEFFFPTSKPLTEEFVNEIRDHTGSNIHVSFELRKKPVVDEVNILDAKLIVDKYDKMPLPEITAMRATVNKAVVLSFELRKRDDPLPWVFSPKYVYHDGKTTQWTPKCISIPDNFTTFFRANIFAVDEGIYHVRLVLDVTSRFGRNTQVSVINEPVAFGFFADQPEMPGKAIQHPPGAKKKRLPEQAPAPKKT